MIVRRTYPKKKRQPEFPKPGRPAKFLCRSGFEVGTISVPTPPDLLGGDRSGILVVPSGEAIGYILDAPGHGYRAAGLANVLERELIRAIFAKRSPLTVLMDRLNQVALDRGILAAATIFRCDTHQIDVTVAGALPPVVFKEGGIDYISVEGTLLGLTARPDFDCKTHELVAGSHILLTSDGVTDTECPRTGGLFDLATLGGILEGGRSLAANLLHCLNAVLAHGAIQQDDISLALIRGNLPASGGLTVTHGPTHPRFSGEHERPPLALTPANEDYRVFGATCGCAN